MTTDDERPSTAERYGRATHASRLKVDAERRGDADMLIAAGMLPDFLGASLLRLQEEFETARARVTRGPALSLTDQLLVLSALKSLRETRDALGRWADWRATKDGIILTPKEVAALTGRALTAFLNPLCPHCEGRGFNGGGRGEHTGPKVICRACGGSGKARNAIGRSAIEVAFVTRILAHMDEGVTNAARGIRRNRGAVDAAKSAVDAEVRAVRGGA